MENVTTDVIDDAVQLCEKAIQTMNDDVMSKMGIREISMEELPFQPGSRKSGILLYKKRKTRQLLEEHAVIVLRNDYNEKPRKSPLNKTSEDEKLMLSGYFKVDFNYIKAEQFLTQQKDKFILSSKRKTLIRFPTPLGTQWNDITIKFIDEHYVSIIIRKKRITSTYREMGFEDSRSNKPDVNWAFLQDLSYSNGEIAWSSKRATVNGKKLKQNLANRLKSFFSINTDPFYEYTKKDGYRIKIHLIPLPGSKNEVKTNTSDQDIQDLYDEMTPGEFTS